MKNNQLELTNEEIIQRNIIEHEIVGERVQRILNKSFERDKEIFSKIKKIVNKNLRW